MGYEEDINVMHKRIYDKDKDGVVDESKSIEGIDSAANSTYYGKDGSGNEGFHPLGSGTGDVVGPSTSTDDNLAAFDGTTGKAIKDSGVKVVTTVGTPGDDVSVPTEKAVRDALNSGGGTDEFVKASVNDTTSGYLLNKVISTDGSVAFDIDNPSGDENVDLSVVQSTIDHVNLLNKGTNTHTQIDNHIANTNNPHVVMATQISDFDVEVENNNAVSLNTTHRTSDGTDHTFINQDLRTTANPEFIAVDYAEGLSNPSYQEGRLFYDNDAKALSYYNDSSNVTMNIGRELWSKSCNNTGSTITDGTIVYISGEDSGCPEISLAQPDEYDKSRIIGVATETITNGSQGEVTSYGLVNDIDTSSLTQGLPVYLGTDGSLTSTKPSGSNYVIVIGNCLVSNATTGVLFVNSVVTDTTVEVTDTNGFPPEWRMGSTPSFTDGTRTFSLAPTGTHFHYYLDGDMARRTTTDTLVIADTEGLHAIYYDDVDGTLAEAVNPSNGDVDVLIRTKCLIAYVYWDATNSEHSYFADERHGISMSPDTHSYLHFTQGAKYLNGLSLGDFDADGSGDDNTAAQFSVASGFTTDEDLITVFSSIGSTTGLPMYYLDGAAGNLRRTERAGFSVRTSDNTSSTRMAYNQWTGTTWQLTEIANNDFGLCHVFAINGVTGEDQQIAIIGQNDYATLTQARAGASTEINDIVAGFPLEEAVPLATVIFQTSTGYDNGVKSRVRSDDDGNDYVDWRTTDLASGTPASDHNNLTNLQLSASGVTWGHVDDQAQTFSGNKTFTDGLTIGGQAITDILISTDTSSTSDDVLVTAGYVDAQTGGSTAVSSWNSRTGNVLPLSGDYDASEVTNAFDTTSNTTDDITDTATNRFTTDTEATKLSGIETGAEVNTVNKVDTPVDNQVSVWTGDGTIEGDANFTWDGNSLTVTGEIMSTSNITVDGATNAFAILDRNSSANFAAFQFKTTGVASGTIGHFNTSTSDMYFKSDAADAGRQQYMVHYVNSETVFNNDGGDQDFRIEGDTDTHAFFVDASTDMVGIGASVPNEKLTVEGVLSLDETTAPSATSGYGKVYVKSSDSGLYYMDGSGTETDLLAGGSGGISWSTPVDSNITVDTNNTYSLGTQTAYMAKLHTDALYTRYITPLSDADTYILFSTDRVQINAGGVEFFTASEGANDEAIINTDGDDVDFRVEGANDTHAMFVEGSSDKTSFGTSTPVEKVTVEGAIALDEITAPTSTSGYGKVYVKSSDNDIYFMDSTGAETSMTASASGGITAVVEDTTPQAGGEFDFQAHSAGFTLQSGTGDGTTTIDWGDGNKYKHTFGAQNETFTFTAPAKPGNFILMLVQDSTGSRTVTWPSSVKWAGGTAPTLTTDASAVDIVSFFYDGTDYYGVGSLDFS